ncbi:metal ABC transporter substrate-binding protein [Lachnobacterium bovis]|uniref:Zinc transport system substrate-binding protein n=1 Tax=Lachnobacterium bovis TaxID=140626 RepID=A0A1H9U2V0_9FIRM|nr:metal ABC transporter substrate-binding protein [Lachnobacterium bovis]SES03487.1 zinc transport system substrate-binding protein [Lachnobacterium bovis]
MKKRYQTFGCILLAILAMFVICTVVSVSFDKSSKKQKSKLIVTSFYPMYVATSNIVDGADVELKNLSEPKTGCLHDFQLTTQDMKLISTSDIFVANGAGMESFLEDIVKEYKNVSIIDSSKGINLLKEEDEENSHIWMGTKTYRQQVKNIAKQLSKDDPDNAKIYMKNAKLYDEKLKKLQKQEKELSSKLTSKNIIIFHEAFAYLAEDLDLDVKYVLDLDEERQVSAGEIADVLSQVKKNKIEYILAEKQYAKSVGDAIERESNVKVIYIDPLNRGKYDKNSYLDGMKKNLDKIEKEITNKQN